MNRHANPYAHSRPQDKCVYLTDSPLHTLFLYDILPIYPPPLAHGIPQRNKKKMKRTTPLYKTCRQVYYAHFTNASECYKRLISEVCTYWRGSKHGQGEHHVVTFLLYVTLPFLPLSLYPFSLPFVPSLLSLSHPLVFYSLSVIFLLLSSSLLSASLLYPLHRSILFALLLLSYPFFLLSLLSRFITPCFFTL